MSPTVVRIAHMFDVLLPEPAELSALDDAALIAAVQACARASAAADARRLAGIAELVRRHCTDEHPDWACDDWDAAAAEVAAALTLGHGRACGQMDLAITLRDRLPRVGALFLAGDIPMRTVLAIAARTALVTDPDALRTLDAMIADRAVKLGPLSVYKLEQALDAWVDQVDPGGVRRTRDNARGRDFSIGDANDTAGTTSVWGRLHTPDAALLGQRLTAMTLGVCQDDPRTMAQRRADAIGALAAGSTHLACRCGHPACPAGADDGRATSITVHVIAEESTTQSRPDPYLNGEGLAPGRDTSSADPPSGDPPGADPHSGDTPGGDPPGADPQASVPTPHRKPALIPGIHGGIIPAPLLAELITHGAKIRIVSRPGAAPEPRYRPSTALDEFVRMRDLTCRFPGCDKPAVHADIDHTVPYPAGATHPSNTKIYCRKHHLVKTFWAGWSDTQLPDGTVIVTSPSGHSYTTTPASRLLFPRWNITTPAAPASASQPETSSARTLMMPTRKRTRKSARASRIASERARNDDHVAERNIPPPF